MGTVTHVGCQDSSTVRVTSKLNNSCQSRLSFSAIWKQKPHLNTPHIFFLYVQYIMAMTSVSDACTHTHNYIYIYENSKACVHLYFVFLRWHLCSRFCKYVVNPDTIFYNSIRWKNEGTNKNILDILACSLPNKALIMTVQNCSTNLHNLMFPENPCLHNWGGVSENNALGVNIR